MSLRGSDGVSGCRRLGFRLGVVSSSLRRAAAHRAATGHKQQTCASWVTHGSVPAAGLGLFMKASILCLRGISEAARKPTVEKGSRSLLRRRLFISPG